MRINHSLKFSTLLAILCFTCFAAQTGAQQTNRPASEPANKPVSEAAKVDDLSITAMVSARELKFETVPNPTVEFSGKPERVTVWEADRRNLPRPVEPGVTYRNIGIELRISSRFADIERIVAEALGEIPTSDAAPPVQTPNAAASPKTPAPAAQNKNP